MIDHGGGGIAADGAEVEMEVEAIGKAAPLAAQPELLVVDEAVLELVLGVAFRSLITCLLSPTVNAALIYPFHPFGACLQIA